MNELARPALFLNVPTLSGEHRQPMGQPGYLSLRTLLRSPPTWDVAGVDIYVCENPNLIAIVADRAGLHCAPMVCTDGMPSAAQRVLLTQLNASGARLRYHGDFDWPGIQIANEVIGTYGASPWRFGAADYASAVGGLTNVSHRLSEGAVGASWDPALTDIMKTHQVAIAEEGLAASLIADLLP